MVEEQIIHEHRQVEPSAPPAGFAPPKGISLIRTLVRHSRVETVAKTFHQLMTFPGAAFFLFIEYGRLAKL
jgi:hypothetical protein